jgi:hypothetical protein
MAHRIAIRYPSDGDMRDGVFIWRRDTDRTLVRLLGGRLFPGVHHQARFDVHDELEALSYRVRSQDTATDIDLDVSSGPWRGTPLFPTFEEIESFFARGDCGFSCGLRGDRLEGLRLRSLNWAMEPLTVNRVASTFYDDRSRFPAAAITLDGAVLMRGISHEWYELDDVPEMAGARTP